jgi:hypothetical protein
MMSLMSPVSRIRLMMMLLIRALLMRPKLLMPIDKNPHFGRRDNLLPSKILSPEPSDITSMSIIPGTKMSKTKSEANTSYCVTLAYFRKLGTHARYVLEA